MKLNSTHGRLFVLINWGKIACIPSFINQINYELIFLFKIDPNESINSKYLLKTILTLNIEAVFLQFIYISNSTLETKISIMLNLKIRINELVKEEKISTYLAISCWTKCF